MMIIDGLTIVGLLAFVFTSAFVLLASRPASDNRHHCRFDACGRPVRG